MLDRFAWLLGCAGGLAGVQIAITLTVSAAVNASPWAGDALSLASAVLGLVSLALFALAARKHRWRALWLAPATAIGLGPLFWVFVTTRILGYDGLDN